MKESSSYYRIVKQGSVLVYLSFHIFTIFIILLMATMRQSILSLGYVFILLLKMKDAAEVLNQRSIQQNKKTKEIRAKIEEIEEKLKGTDDSKIVKKAAMEAELSDLKEQLMALTGTTKKASFVQKQAEKKARSFKEWPMIKTIKRYLLIYGLIDFTLQVIV